MKWKKIVSLLLVAVLVCSLFAAFGSSLASGDEYPDSIRLEVRMEQSVGVGDTATGVLDAFLQAVEGPIYDGVDDEWKAQLTPLESYGSYNNLFFNSAFTEESGVEVDIDDDGTLRFNPFAIREVRYASNWLLNRQLIVEDLYDGYSLPQYQAITPRNPSYNDELRQVDEAHGLTYEGDFDYGYNMIQDAMEAQITNPDLQGDLRGPDDSDTNFWQYRPPGEDWMDVEVHGLIRIEDRRLQIGHLFSDALEDSHISAVRDEQDRAAIGIWLFTDPADMLWSWYTGGWIASTAVAYQHSTPVQMYTDYWPFMPGTIVGGRYVHLRDEDYAEDLLYEHAIPLMAGQIPTEEEYWDTIRHISYVGIEQSIRVFISNSQDFVPINRDSITEVATDAVTGWSQIFSPRTVKTLEGGTLRTAQYSAGVLYMDNFNNIDGSSDYYGIMQQRMAKDYATYLHPSTGLPISKRADFVATPELADMFDEFEEGDLMLREGWDYDDEGNLITSLELPDDNIWYYDVMTEEWLEGGYEFAPGELTERDTVATAVTYQYNLGKWHSGHDVTLRDILAWHAWSKQLAFNEDWGALGGEHFHGAWGVGTRPGFLNTIAIEVDEDNDLITFYGDYTFPARDMIASYYASFPLHPWHMYEAVTHLRGGTEYADSGATDDDLYEWSNLAGSNYVHWISSDQTIDFKNTLENLKNNEVIPPYLQSGPLQITADEFVAEIEAIQAYQEEYELSFISQGPFKFVRYDTANLVVELERHEYPDYAFPNDYWRDRLYIAELRHGTMSAPAEITGGEDLTTDVRVRIFESFPDRRTRNLNADEDDYSSTLVVYDMFDAEVYRDEDPEVINTDGSYFEVTIPGHVTVGWDGVYELEFTSEIAGQLTPAVSRRSVLVEPAVFELENHELEVVPTSGEAPLDVDITVSADNPGDEAGSEDVIVDGQVIGTLTVAAGETDTETFSHTFTVAGDYTVSFGPESQVVNVAPREVPPGLINYELDVSPTSGDAPLDVTIEVSVENEGEEDAEDHVYVGGSPEYLVEVPAGETVTETFTHTFNTGGTYLISWGEHDEVVSVAEDVDEPELVGHELSVDPTSGEAPLEVEITVSVENVGGAQGTVDLIIDGRVEDSLTVPAGETVTETYTHEFDEQGNYLIEFGPETVTVEVEEETPGFMFVLLALSAVFAVVIYHAKKKR